VSDLRSRKPKTPTYFQKLTELNWYVTYKRNCRTLSYTWRQTTTPTTRFSTASSARCATYLVPTTADQLYADAGRRAVQPAHREPRRSHRRALPRVPVRKPDPRAIRGRVRALSLVVAVKVRIATSSASPAIPCLWSDCTPTSCYVRPLECQSMSLMCGVAEVVL